MPQKYAKWDMSGNRLVSDEVRAERLLQRGGAPSSINTATAVTYTTTHVLSGIIVRDPNGGSRTDTFPTATAMVAAVPGVEIGDTFQVHIINGADAAETLTLAEGTGGGFDTNQTATSRVISQFGSKDVYLRITGISPPAYVLYA